MAGEVDEILIGFVINDPQPKGQDYKIYLRWYNQAEETAALLGFQTLNIDRPNSAI